MRAKVLDYALIVKRINFWAILKVAIALAVLMYLFHLVEFDRMTAALRRANLILIIVALVLAPLNIFWLFMRWNGARPGSIRLDYDRHRFETDNSGRLG